MNGYATIRELLSYCLNQRLIEITQHDPEEFMEDGAAFVMLHFENGATLTFPIGDEGFQGTAPADEWYVEESADDEGAGVV